MPDRTSELRRQRELLREHLAWIERELAAAQAAHPSDRPQAPVPPALSAHAPPAQDPESILAQYRRPATSVGADVKRGCLSWFAAAFVFLALLAAAAYLAYAKLSR